MTLSYRGYILIERISKLSGGVAVIKVGAPTEVELKELKLRIEETGFRRFQRRSMPISAVQDLYAWITSVPVTICTSSRSILSRA